MIVTDQEISETTPKMLSVDTATGCGSLGLKTVWTVYSGLVPMSPKTTPRAPTARAPWAVARRFTWPSISPSAHQSLAHHRSAGLVAAPVVRQRRGWRCPPAGAWVAGAGPGHRRVAGPRGRGRGYGGS